MRVRLLGLVLLLTTSLAAQDFERVGPKEPTEFNESGGKIYGPSGAIRKVDDGDQIIIKKLEGVILTNERMHISDEEIRRAVGTVDTINVKVPGSLKSLNALLSDKFLHRPLTKQGILDLKSEIILYYRRWGRPMVTLEIPVQKITDGVLQIIVIEGRLGEVKVEGNKYFKEETLRNYIRLKEGEVIDSNILITDVEWINRNPFRQVDVVYAPGEIAGTTDIRLLTLDRRPWRVYAGVDNTGYDETDNTRIFAGANWGNAFGIDHILSIQFTSAPNIDRFWALTGHYTIPLPWRDVWVFYGGYSHVHGDMNTPSLRSTGYSAQGSTRYNFILKPHPGILQELTLGADFKRTNNNLDFGGERIFSQSINLTQLVFGYNLGYMSEWAKSSFTVEFFCSPGSWLPDQSGSDYRKARFKGNSNYFYGRFAFAPILRLPRDFAFALTFRGQASSRNLIASEQFGLGGYNTIRGYKEREVNVDDAFLASAELRSPPLSFIGQRVFKDMLQLLIFLDYGIGRDVHTAPGDKRSQYLLSFGPGLRYDINPYLNFRADLGIQLHKLDSRGFRFHYSLVASY
ncbi:MAG: Heme/hemopexin transporter protein HuxB [Chlamydiae bacterium]|nr:Heme/hemopexin transporter protein HuxB [Chlamydiota bacterium]